MLRILFVLTLSILLIACSDDGQPPNPIVTPQPEAPTGSHTESQNQKIENIEHVVDGLMKEWQQIKADLDAGITPDIDSLKTSVDQLISDLEKIDEQLEKLSMLINATATASTPDDFGSVGEPNQSTPVHGEIVFYRQSEGHDIWIMDSDGKNQRRLTTHPATDSFPAWSHDGQQLAFLSSRRGAQLQHAPNIWVMDADGSNLQLAVETNPLEGIRIDGPPRWMAFGGIAYKRLDDVITGNKHILYDNDPLEVVWSQQGHVALVEYSTDAGQEDIYIEPLFDRRIRLTHNPAADDQPAWNPEGDRIAYRSHTGATTEILVVNIDGAGHRNLTNHPGDDGWPTWSPDGNHIAFQSNRDNRFDWDIYVIDAKGANLRNLTNNLQHNEIQPAWRPR